MASRAQLGTTALVAVPLAVLGLRFPARLSIRVSGVVPSPWIAGLATAVLGFGVLTIPNARNWDAFAAMLGVDAVFVSGVAVFSRRASCINLHTLSPAEGGALAHGVHAFIEHPNSGAGLPARIGNGIILAAALPVIVAVAKSTGQALGEGRHRLLRLRRKAEDQMTEGRSQRLRPLCQEVAASMPGPWPGFPPCAR